MLVFRIFNRPYFFGKTSSIGFAILAQIISMMIIISIIIGLYFQKIWAWYLTLIDISIGFINHIVVIGMFLINPEIISPSLLSQNTVVNGTFTTLYIPLTFYWIILATILYKNKNLFT